MPGKRGEDERDQSPSQPLRVVFAEDNYLVREGTSALLRDIEQVDLVAVVETVDELLRAVEEHSPDAVLTDIRMPPTHTVEGIDAARRIRAERPDVGVVLLSQYLEQKYAHELLREDAKGVGYLLKERIRDVDDLVRALEVVARGGVILDPDVVRRLLVSRSQDSPLSQLTQRELEVLEQMALAKTNQGIGKSLFLSEKAVERNINSLFSKLGLAEEPEVHRRVKAVLTFLEHSG